MFAPDVVRRMPNKNPAPDFFTIDSDGYRRYVLSSGKIGPRCDERNRENMPNGTEAELFEAVIRIVLSVGGDGEGYILSPEWEQLAGRFKGNKQFSKILENNPPNQTTFYDGQESITFGDIDTIPGEHADVIIILRWPIL